jgi:Uma2 family endonuclease
MTTLTTNYLDAVKTLPVGGTLILTDVPFEEYEQLLSDLSANPGLRRRVRVSYYRGKLWVMTLSPLHEKFKGLALCLAQILSEELECDLESLGSTTFKSDAFSPGAEPDTCFYVTNAPAIIGKEKIDLSVDPPPDVVVEIDLSHSSPGQQELYAAMGVPELWTYDLRRARIYHLSPPGYAEAAASRAFPLLTAEALTEFLEQSKTVGQSAALRDFREWVRQRRAQA